MPQEPDRQQQLLDATYSDSKHPAVAESATKALRSALSRATSDAVSIADFWDVFSAFTQRYQYGQFIDALVHEMKTDLRNAIQREYHDELRMEAREAIKSEIRKLEGDSISSEVYNELREEIEAEVLERLTAEVEEEARGALNARLKAELAPNVETALKVELMGDPAFVEEARKEIQRKILGLQ